MEKPYTVKELIAALEKLPANAAVVLSHDAEGNNFGFFDNYSIYENTVILYPRDHQVQEIGELIAT